MIDSIFDSLIMIAIIVAIGLIQCYIFFAKTLPGIRKFKNIFPSTEAEKYAQLNKNNWVIGGDTNMSIGIDEKSSSTLLTIRDAINRYLKENASRTSDFALLKDIVDRNCDAVEEDTRELIPLPLYLGLAGTMLGIAFGVGSLVFGGGLDAMFDPDQSAVSARGIAPLLKDVSLAMVCSFVGLIFTTRATFVMRNSKTKVEREKHSFLSWMQAKLLPEMPDNMSSVVMKLTGNLTEFNRSFSVNANRLNTTLNAITEASSQNARLLEAVNELKQVRVAGSNLQLYDRLSAATQEIGTLAEYLENCSSYLKQVKALNNKLDASEERMKAIEEMGEYFMKEKSQVEHVSKLTQDTIGQADEEIRRSTKQFGDNIEKYFALMQENLQIQATNIGKVLAEQQQILNKKAGEMSQVVAELKNMADMKKTMSNLLDTYREQNRLLSVVLNQRGRDTSRDASRDVLPLQALQSPSKLPKWLSIMAIIVAISILVAVFLYVAQTFHLFNM